MKRVLPALANMGVPLLYAGVALVLLGPAIVTRCGDTIFGGAGDSTAGLIWLEWNYDTLDASPFRTRTPLLNAPAGAPLWQPFYVTALLLMLPMWAASQVVGPVCSWNVAVLAGFVLNGWVMYLFVRWLTRSVPVALLAGLTFVLLPYHYQKASGHLAYVHTWVFALILWAGLWLAQRPSMRRGAVLGAAVAAAAYVDGYYLLIATIFGGAIAVLGTVASRRVASLTVRLKSIVAAGVVLGVSLIPMLVVLATNSNTISAAVERSASDVAVYSARPWEYVLPARHNPLLPDRIAAWQDRNLHESNYSEQTLYLGALPLIGTAAMVVMALRNRRRRLESPLSLQLPALVIVVGGAALISLLMSAPPKVSVAGTPIPMPSGVVSKFLAFWRVYARFFIPVAVCAIALAASALSLAVTRLGGRRGVRSGIVSVLLVPVVVVDFLPPRPAATFSYQRDTPAEYRWLDDREPGQIIAEYPLDPPPLPNHITYLSYQRTHQQRLLNGAPAGTKGAHLAAGLAGLADPQTVPALAGLGVRYVIVHPTTFGHPVDDAAIPAALRLAYESPTGRVYEVDARVAAPVTLAPGVGFHPSDTSPSLISSRWMRAQATLAIRRLGGRPPARMSISFDAVSFGIQRQLEILQGGRVVWRGDVSADKSTTVAFDVADAKDLRLRATPAAVAIKELIPESNDDRRVALNIAKLSISAK